MTVRAVMFFLFCIPKNIVCGAVGGRGLRTLVPKSLQQKNYLACLNNPVNKIVVGMGPAGTGKTFFACHVAIQELREQNVNKIVVTRPVVSVDENLGFLPGDLSKKMDPFTRPIFDIFLEYFTKQQINALIDAGRIEISALGFMRGRTFKDSFVIADEMQNSSPSQMKMLLTRLGDNSRLVITGDLQQSDVGVNNGLNDFMGRIRGKELEGIRSVSFDSTDIQRSRIVETIIGIYSVPPSPTSPDSKLSYVRYPDFYC
jgi:phosphate starvation-inducible PhoH-like protein